MFITKSGRRLGKPLSAKIRITVPKDSLTPEEKAKILKAVGEKLGTTVRVKSVHKAPQVGEDHILPPVKDAELAYYRVFDLKGFYNDLCRFLGIKGLAKAIRQDEFYKPDGLPCTPEELDLLDRFINGNLAISPAIPETLAVRAFLVGRIASELETNGKLVKVAYKNLPTTVEEAMGGYPLTDVERRAIEFGKFYAGEKIMAMQEDTRRLVRQIIVESRQNSVHPRRLAQTLFDRVVDTDANLNRDWQRVAITEANNMASNGFLGTMVDGQYVIWHAHPDACAYCRSQHYKVFKVTDNPPEDYGHLDPGNKKYKEIAKRWETEVWVGKNNYGRSTALKKRTPKGLMNREHHERATVVIPLHPHCRCRWFRFDPEVQFVNDKGRIQFRLREREDEYQKWLKANPQVREFLGKVT